MVPAAPSVASSEPMKSPEYEEESLDEDDDDSSSSYLIKSRCFVWVPWYKSLQCLVMWHLFISDQTMDIIDLFILQSNQINCKVN